MSLVIVNRTRGFVKYEARRVEFVVNAYFRKARYLLEYSYQDSSYCLSWISAGGKVQFRGEGSSRRVGEGVFLLQIRTRMPRV